MRTCWEKPELIVMVPLGGADKGVYAGNGDLTYVQTNPPSP